MNIVIFVLSYQLLIICTSDIINCIGEQKCEDEQKNCHPNEACYITCNGTSSGQQACIGTTIRGVSATNVTLDCIHKQDCYDTKLTCGTGTCVINCHGNTNPDHVEQCKFTAVDCGRSVCKIHCNGVDSCGDSEFDLRNAISFECFGDCPSSYPSPTHVPTTNPPHLLTTNPTIYPTTNPTHIPTINPIINPTESPNNLPSKYEETQTTRVSVNTTEYYLHAPIDGSVNPYVTKERIEIIESEEGFSIHTIVKNIPLVIIFGLIIIVLICMVFICIFYTYKIRKRKKQKQISDNNIVNKQPKYNNIPMNVSKDDNNENENGDNTGLKKTDSISENKMFKDTSHSNEGCTAIQMGELDVFEVENDEKVKNDHDECIIQTESYKHTKQSINHFKTPSNSFSSRDKIDLNDDELIIDGDSESGRNYDEKKRKITEGH